MPKPRKIWRALIERETTEPSRDLSPAQLLMPRQIEPEPPIPNWAITASFKALLGSDNHNIPPARAKLLLPKLEEFTLLLSAIEDEGVELPQAMKEQLVAWFVLDTLKTKPPLHPKSVLEMHCKIVDSFIDNMRWPFKIRNNSGSYSVSLTQHLPALFDKLSLCHNCLQHCPAHQCPSPCDIQKTFLSISGRAKLRDAIVASYHGIAPSTLRDLRGRKTTRRRRILRRQDS